MLLPNSAQRLVANRCRRGPEYAERVGTSSRPGRKAQGPGADDRCAGDARTLSAHAGRRRESPLTMNEDATFRTVLGVGFLAVLIITLYHRLRSWASKER